MKKVKPVYASSTGWACGTEVIFKERKLRPFKKNVLSSALRKYVKVIWKK